MRKSTSYMVDVSLNSDGVIQEGECGAGQGPAAHCKHIATVVFGLTCFCQAGNILTELTCTQVLQTFHHTKAFKGSPLKSSQFQTISSRIRFSTLVFDPKPVHLRNRVERSATFHNACLNFIPQTKQPMPALQLFKPANTHALAHDHNHLELCPEDQYLKVTEITAQQANDVEKSTRGQSQNKAWRETRLHHITSSNFGDICKITDRKNMPNFTKPFITYRDLKTEAVLHGQKYDHVAVEKFEQKWGTKTEVCGLFISEDYPQLAASPDRVIDNDTLLAVKCPYFSRNKHVSPQNVPYLKQHDGKRTLDTSHDYYYQI